MDAIDESACAVLILKIGLDFHRMIGRDIKNHPQDIVIFAKISIGAQLIAIGDRVVGPSFESQFFAKKLDQRTGKHLRIAPGKADAAGGQKSLHFQAARRPAKSHGGRAGGRCIAHLVAQNGGDFFKNLAHQFPLRLWVRVGAAHHEGEHFAHPWGQRLPPA